MTATEIQNERKNALLNYSPFFSISSLILEYQIDFIIWYTPSYFVFEQRFSCFDFLQQLQPQLYDCSFHFLALLLQFYKLENKLCLA